MRKSVKPRSVPRWAFELVQCDDPSDYFPLYIEGIGYSEEFALGEQLRVLTYYPPFWQTVHPIEHMWSIDGEFLYGVCLIYNRSWYRATKL
jgi:hypothetical protein